jgi:hypothetical protein
MIAPFYPVIYVRGYAMSAHERDEATADPFCGFNTGSTVYRASVDKAEPPRKFIFESPLLRLFRDFDYQDIYENGSDITEPDWQPRPGAKGIPSRSVIIYRYYEDGSDLLGDGKAKDILEYSKGLGKLIDRVRELVLKQEGGTADDFRCYLVAHSMGGLVVRGFLQSPEIPDEYKDVRRSVAKFFTYATPHNGIEVAGVNVPDWLALAKINTFNRARIAELLDMKETLARYGRVDFMPETVMPIENVFCMVGTNRLDYDVAAGLSRTFVGHGSDGLVKVENASLWALDASGQVTQPAATAFAYRSHSGYFGIVNSEEAYQNLTRFLFGDIRVDIWLSVDAVTLPKELQGRDVEALYQFELRAGPRGKRWLLSRRLAEEDSPACRTHVQLTDPAQKAARQIYLSTLFLANRSRVNQSDPSLAYSMDLGVRVPDYQIEHRFWADGHFEGAYLFRDALIVSMVPPTTPGGEWNIVYGWQGQTGISATQPLDYRRLGQGKFELRVPLPGGGEPGIEGEVLLTASAWNA